MRRALIAPAMIAILLLTFLIAGVQAVAAPGNLTLNWGAKINAGQCGHGKLIINVTYSVSSYDGGYGGNDWAHDYARRHLQVWQTGQGTFCALVQDVGRFVTISGTSPSGNGTVSDGVEGTYQGGIEFTFTNATLKSSPDYGTRGNIGTFEYPAPMSSIVHWMGCYFSSYDLTYGWWGWIYRTPHNGTWYDSDSGSSGDITG